MRKSIVLLSSAAFLLAFSASAKVNVSKYSITIDEPVNEQNFGAAFAECQKKGGKTPSVRLKKCDDAGLAAVMKVYPGVMSLDIQKSPNLKSIAALANAKIRTLTIKDAAVADLAPIATLKDLQNLTIEKVSFTNPDLSFCPASLKSFSLSDFPATLKSVAGIDKCASMNNLTFRHNGGATDLSPLANFKKLRRISLSYYDAPDLAAVAKMPALTDLNLYGSKNIDLAPLAACKKLKSIMIYATKQVKDYNALGNIKSLEFVNAGLTPMKDLSWAPNLPNLKRLDLFAESFDSYAPLGQCKKLENLTFWSMKGTIDVAQFADGIAPLKKLSFAGSTIVNEAKLAGLAKPGKLVELNLSELNKTGYKKPSKPIDIAFLPALTTVETLYLQKTVVIDIEPLTKMTGLKNLTIDETMKSKLAGKLKDVKIRVY